MIQEKYNEEEYAKQIEQHGFLTERHNYELVLLVKYWKKLGIKPKQRKEKLYEFCKKYIVNFNDVLYFKQINTALKNIQDRLTSGEVRAVDLPKVLQSMDKLLERKDLGKISVSPSEELQAFLSEVGLPDIVT